VSGIVSRLDIEGDRDRRDVGVLGEDDDADEPGYIGSFTRYDGGLAALGENEEPGWYPLLILAGDNELA
jgi:hypothetical protein